LPLSWTHDEDHCTTLQCVLHPFDFDTILDVLFLLHTQYTFEADLVEFSQHLRVVKHHPIPEDSIKKIKNNDK
jgi:hypothetical protein